MNIVLYSNDLEPITILDLPMWAIDMLAERGRIRVAVMPEVNYSPVFSSVPIFDACQTVEIHNEWLIWKDKSRKQILVTPNDELALKLNAGWLPGQQAKINQYQRRISFLSQLILGALGGEE